jgi:mannose-6-phosphate isomerase-like protein (cupin superfamily)
MVIHEDNRRCLIEWATGEFRECKAATMKQDGVLGNHWHARKDEVFLLLQGHASYVKIGDDEWNDIAAPFTWEVPCGTYHAFHLKAGSVLLGAATELYDKSDERTDVRDSAICESA